MLTLDRETAHYKQQVALKYAELVYYGYWFSPEMELLRRTIDESQKGVTGTARIKPYKGSCEVVGRKSGVSLYDPAFATFEEDEVYRQRDAEGFIRLNALRLRIRALRTQREVRALHPSLPLRGGRVREGVRSQEVRPQRQAVRQAARKDPRR